MFTLFPYLDVSFKSFPFVGLAGYRRCKVAMLFFVAVVGSTCAVKQFYQLELFRLRESLGVCEGFSLLV